MLTHIASAYALTWLVALAGALAVEAARLNSLAKLSPLLDWVGLVCVAWMVGPLGAPVWAGAVVWTRVKARR